MIGNHRDPGKEHSQDDKIEREKLGQKKIMTFKCCQKKATRACVTVRAVSDQHIPSDTDERTILRIETGKVGDCP